MLLKITLLALLAALAQGTALHGHGATSSFSYGVSDPHTGDVKNQHEQRIGDSVVGQYSLLESDGTKRVVDYAAHPHTGFNAIVRKDPVSIHPSSALVAPAAYGSHGLYGASAAEYGYGGYGYGGYATPYSYAYQTPAVSAYSTSVAHHGAYGAGYSPYGLGHSYGSNLYGYGALAGYGGYGSLGHGLAAPLAHGYGYGGYGYGAGLW